VHVAQVTKKHHVQIATGLPRHNSSLLIALSEDRDQLKAPSQTVGLVRASTGPSACFRGPSVRVQLVAAGNLPPVVP